MTTFRPQPARRPGACAPRLARAAVPIGSPPPRRPTTSTAGRNGSASAGGRMRSASASSTENGPTSSRRRVAAVAAEASAIDRTYVPEPTRRSSLATPSLVREQLEHVHARAPDGHLHRLAAPVAAGTRARLRSSPPRRPARGARPRPGARPGAARARRRRAARPPRRPLPRIARSMCGCSGRSRSCSACRARRARARAGSPRRRARAGARSRTGRASPRGPVRARVRRRMPATTWNEDGPAGLSTRISPEGLRPRGGTEELLAQERLDLVDRLGGREAGGQPVAAPAPLARDRGDVELVAGGAQRIRRCASAGSGGSRIVAAISAPSTARR